MAPELHLMLRGLSQFQICIDRIDEVSKGSLGISGEDENMHVAREIPILEIWQRKAISFITDMKAIFDTPSDTPNRLFERERYTRLDEVVKRHMEEWRSAGTEMMNDSLITMLKTTSFRHCNGNFKELFLTWVLASLSRQVDDENFIWCANGWRCLRKYMCWNRSLSWLLAFGATDFVFNTDDPSGTGQITRKLTPQEANGLIKDYMAYIQLALMEEDIDTVVNISLSYRQRATFRHAMAS